MSVMPSTVLKKLYVTGSLRTIDGGFAFDLKNLIAPATITRIDGLEVNGVKVDDSCAVFVSPSGALRAIDHVSPGRPVQFPIGKVVTLRVDHEGLEPGRHDLTIHIHVKEIGSLEIPISDSIA